MGRRQGQTQARPQNGCGLSRPGSCSRLVARRIGPTGHLRACLLSALRPPASPPQQHRSPSSSFTNSTLPSHPTNTDPSSVLQVPLLQQTPIEGKQRRHLHHHHHHQQHQHITRSSASPDCFGRPANSWPALVRFFSKHPLPRPPSPQPPRLDHPPCSAPPCSPSRPSPLLPAPRTTPPPARSPSTPASFSQRSSSRGAAPRPTRARRSAAAKHPQTLATR